MPIQRSLAVISVSWALTAVGCSSDSQRPAGAVTSGGAGNRAGAFNGQSGSAAGSGAAAGANTGFSGANAGAGDSGSSSIAGSASSGGVDRAGEAGSNGVAGAPGSSGSSSAGAGPTSELPDGPLLAFPGAQGFGKNAVGGRGGTVYHVTNLDDSGFGSFRDAVGTPNRIVVFDVGGYVQLKTAVSVKSNLTIAGQTAPGGGIGFRGGEISFANSSNIICRYLRIRPGSETESEEDDALSLYRAQNVIVDHSSLEFAPWNNIDAVSDDWQAHPVTNITFQDSLIANPTGQQFGAHMESVSSQQAWYRNIFANSHNRNPLAKADTVFVNNLLYNYGAGYTTHTSTAFRHDIVNNYFVFGPASTGTDNTWFQVDKNQAIYAAGNRKDTNLNGALDGAETIPYWYQGTGTVLKTAWSAESSSGVPLDASSAARVAISLAGPFPRDALDAMIIAQVMTLGKGPTGTGTNSAGPDSTLYTSQTQTGLSNNGYGEIATGTKLTDSDNDGMPDTWERAMGSDPQTDDAMMKASSGYTLLERYLNWLAVPHATSTGSALNVDLTPYSSGFSPVSPSFAVGAAKNGSVALGSDKHSARFQPLPGFKGLASFDYAVSGSDGTSFSNRVLILVTP